VSPVQRVPANTSTTAGTHFRSLLGSGPFVVGGAVAAVVAFTIGAAVHRTPIMAGGPLLVVLAVVAYAWFRATRDAENEFFNRFAGAHELNHWREYALSEFTPLLAGGDPRRCKHWMEAGGRGVGWYTFEVRHDNGDNKDTWEAHDFTIATVDLGEHGMSRFQGVYLRRRRGMFERLDSDANWLRGENVEKVELESTQFTERYELWRDRDQDEIALRQLFAPSFVIWLAGHPLAPGFELRAGELVVFVPGHTCDAGNLEFLLMAAAEISRRIQAELAEATQAGSL
jgi:hypothetical protein